MKFELDSKEYEKLREWKLTHKKVYDGCSGGRYTYSFTPTSLGTVCKITDNITKEVLDVTDYDTW